MVFEITLGFIFFYHVHHPGNIHIIMHSDGTNNLRCYTEPIQYTSDEFILFL